MPALPADIAAGTRPAQIETWSSSAIKARYPNARDGSEPVAEGFFDNTSDAAAAIAARGALIGTDRRRFAVTAAQVVWPDLSAGIFPAVALIDPEYSVNGTGLVARIEVSLEDETTAFEVFL
jgi:hypothetical protein